MKKVLLSSILTICSLGFTFANNSTIEGFTPKDGSDKITIITKNGNEQTSNIQASKARVVVQEIENDDLGLGSASNIKEVEISSTKFTDDSFIYVKERKDLVGYALQLASFSDLTVAKEFALSIAHKGDAEKKQLFIYTVNTSEKTFYKVYFGLLKTDEVAREKQRTLLTLGYSPFVKEFR